MTDSPRRTDRWIDRLSPALFTAAAGLVACLVTLYFFCPRFYIWRGIEYGIPDMANHPEINRALVVLEQLKNPDVKIDNPSNTVVEWRLLFPQLGHELGLGRTAFLSLTFFGCWAAASLIAAVMSRRLDDRMQGFWATLLACSSGWFFTSTAWLTYNDSWIVLGLVAVAFVRSRWVLAATCFLECWIEERFLLVLPTALALRTFTFPRDAAWLRTFAYDVLTAVGGAAPYLLARFNAYSDGSDPHTAEYLAARAAESFPLGRYFEGALAGLRCNWIFVGVWAWLAARTSPRWWSATAITGVMFSILVCLKSAGDLHRSAAMFVVVALAGIVMLHRAKPMLCAKALPLLALLSLVLPASHVITVFKIPIYGAMVEWDRSEHILPVNFTPEFYYQRAMQYVQTKQTDQALFYFDYALRLNPKFREATFYKALTMSDIGRRKEAEAVLTAALKVDADWPEGLYLRARCREQLGDYLGALGDYTAAARKAPADSQVGGEAQKALQRLGAKPAPAP